MCVEVGSEPHVGLFIHGRSLDSPDLRRMLWGFGTITVQGIGAGGINNRMGTIPTALMTALDIGPENVHFSIGSGASTHLGLDGSPEIEAEYIKRQAQDFETLEKFPQIRHHPRWRDDDSRQILATAIREAHTDTKAQNTREEVANAAAYFGEQGIDRIVQVTGMSHAVRCLIDRTSHIMEQSLRGDSDYYPAQRWTLVSDNEPYPFHYLSQPIYVEPPHRGDIFSGLPEKLWFNNLMGDIFTLDPARRIRLAGMMRSLIDYLNGEEADSIPDVRKTDIWLPSSAQ